MMGVGPTSQAWEARILPMYYTRIYLYYILFACFSQNKIKFCCNFNLANKKKLCKIQKNS